MFSFVVDRLEMTFICFEQNESIGKSACIKELVPFSKELEVFAKVFIKL